MRIQEENAGLGLRSLRSRPASEGEEEGITGEEEPAQHPWDLTPVVSSHPLCPWEHPSHTPGTERVGHVLP